MMRRKLGVGLAACALMTLGVAPPAFGYGGKSGDVACERTASVAPPGWTDNQHAEEAYAS